MLVVAYATGRASHARQVKGDDPNKKGYPGPPGWGLGVRLTTSPCKKNILLRNLKRRPRPTQGCRADDDDDVDELATTSVSRPHLCLNMEEVKMIIYILYEFSLQY